MAESGGCNGQRVGGSATKAERTAFRDLRRGGFVETYPWVLSVPACWELLPVCCVSRICSPTFL